MNTSKVRLTGIRMLLTLAVGVILTLSSSMAYAQVQQRPQKPGLNATSFSTGQMQAVQTSNLGGGQMGYWSHLTAENTGDIPFGEPYGNYQAPYYWNYIFVDSHDRVFTDSNGLFVWDGANWNKVMTNGEQVNHVREMIEDDSGHLWVGTSNGLFEFSSSLNFIQEHHIGNSNMKKNDVNALLQADDGSIWIGHRWHDDGTGGGVTILNETVIDSINGYTSDIIKRSNGDIWVTQNPDPDGTNGLIYVYRPSNDSSWAYTESNSGLPHTEVDNFTEDSQGNLWMGLYTNQDNTMGGVVKYDGSSWTYYDQADGLPQAGAWYTYAASNDDIYYGTGDSLMVYDGSSWSHFTNGNDKYPLRGVSMITEDRDGNLLLGSGPGADFTGGGIHIYDGSSWEFMSNYNDNGLFSNIIFGADVDTDGNLWLSGFFGAAMYDGSTWTHFSENDGMADTYAWKVVTTSDGSVWFAVAGDISKYKDGEFTTYSQYQDFAETIFEDSQGNVWFGAYDWVSTNNDGGILKYDGSTFTVYDDTDGIIGNHVTAFGEGPNGKIYASTDAGAIVFDGSSWSEFTVDGQTGAPVNELASDSNNNLWFDTQGAIKKWDGSTWAVWDNTAGYMGFSGHIEPADDGSIWIGGPAVQVIKNGNLFDMTPSGFNGFSYAITHDDQGQTWVGTYGDGIYKYDMSEALTIESVTDYPDDQGKRVTVKAGGFLMDPHRLSDSQFNPTSWGVEIKNGDSWETLNTSSNLAGDKQLSVDLPTTMPTGENLAEHKYELRVGVYEDGGDIAYSNSQMAYAFDNVAPAAVGGVSASRGSNAVTVSWGSSNADDFQRYDVVLADNPNATPLVSTTQNSVILSDAQYSGLQKVAVRTRDKNKNWGDASTAAVATFPMELTYNVQKRWNLLGLPLDADSDDIATVLSKVEDGTLYKFSGSYKEVETIEPGKGYWAKFDANASYNVEGLPVAEQMLNLNKGWNLISGVGAPLDFSQVQDSDEILITGTLSGFNGSYTQANTMAPGAGYWVRASKAGSVTLSLVGGTSTEIPTKKQPILAQAKEKLNKLVVHSSKGYQKALYFGKELAREVNPLSFSLPPKAPGNAFDVRLSKEDMSYTKAHMFTVDLQKQQESRVTVTLGLLPTNEYQKYVVQELKGNKVLAEYTLTDNKAVTLKNSEVSGLKISAEGLQQSAESLPDQFDLSQSYPNPFNPSTTIQYQLPQQVSVRLEVFDMVGRKVKTLMAGEQQEAGTHTIRFNASQLSSGMYFVRLEAGSFQEIQKITLIK